MDDLGRLAAALATSLLVLCVVVSVGKYVQGVEGGFVERWNGVELR